MSLPTDIAQIIALYDSMLGDNYLGWVPIALLIYDFVLTFDREVELFWKRKLTSASVLFILTSCNRLVKTAAITEYMQSIPWAAFSALRGFALTKNRGIAAVIFTLSVAPVGVILAQFVLGISGAAWPVAGCLATYTNTPRELIMSVLNSNSMPSPSSLTNISHVPIVSRGGQTIADFILVVATWRTLGTAAIRPSMTKRSRGSIAAIMLWNGLLYFIVLFALNVIHLALWLTSVFGNPVSFMTEFTDPLTTILITRFLLDLQEAEQRDMKLDSDNPLHFPRSYGALSFARVMGSVGETIVPGAARKDACEDYLDSEGDGDLDSFELALGGRWEQSC
ncbi:hypothetical protein L227DRAFT_616969 [Lentinus tigrinus ALCF2SS1-6]|uniref:DUF6533 domain-containing protein n=1 Tax=Lentinus tigrinus ALCF2SS1-6 TaxID=1328759 RepID=A0A5C2RPB7_9APHY|nr:hypothetical protein L227DRAFT_616969 [Lentinus tigrinus ALCF2SS1-6]